MPASILACEMRVIFSSYSRTARDEIPPPRSDRSCPPCEPETGQIGPKCTNSQLENLPVDFATYTSLLQQTAVILDSKAVGCAVVNLDQFRITTRTILAKEHFWIGLVRSRPRKTITNEV